MEKRIDVSIGPFTALLMIFVTLKLAGLVGWSWWWVTAPFWGPWILVMVVALVAVALK